MVEFTGFPWPPGFVFLWYNYVYILLDRTRNTSKVYHRNYVPGTRRGISNFVESSSNTLLTLAVCTLPTKPATGQASLSSDSRGNLQR